MCVVGALYFASLLWIGFRGWPIRAGLVSGAIAIVPLVLQRAFLDSDAPGFAFMAVPMLGISLLFVAIGVSFAIIHFIRKLRQNKVSSKAD